MTLFSTLHSATFGFWQPKASRRSALGRALSAIAHAHLVWQQRQSLQNMDASLLDDIGLNRADAMAEAARPIWDVPKTWLH